MDNRVKLAKELRKQRYKWQEIANILGISRQWLHEIMKKEEDDK